MWNLSLLYEAEEEVSSCVEDYNQGRIFLLRPDDVLMKWTFVMTDLFVEHGTRLFVYTVT